MTITNISFKIEIHDQENAWFAYSKYYSIVNEDYRTRPSRNSASDLLKRIKRTK